MEWIYEYRNKGKVGVCCDRGQTQRWQKLDIEQAFGAENSDRILKAADHKKPDNRSADSGRISARVF